MADGTRAEHLLPARKDRREHVVGIIRRDALEVSTTLVKRGSPYCLLCVKNTARYDAARARYDAAVSALADLSV